MLGRASISPSLSCAMLSCLSDTAALSCDTADSPCSRTSSSLTELASAVFSSDRARADRRSSSRARSRCNAVVKCYEGSVESAQGLMMKCNTCAFLNGYTAPVLYPIEALAMVRRQEIGT